MKKISRLYRCTGRNFTNSNDHHQKDATETSKVLVSCVPLQNVDFSSRKEFAPRGSDFFPLREVPYYMVNDITTFEDFHQMCTRFNTRVRNCVLGGMSMNEQNRRSQSRRNVNTFKWNLNLTK